MNRIEQRMSLLTNEYLKAFLAFTIKRCRSYDDALELTDEIIINCISVINKDEDIQNFNAYLWSIAHNTYKRYLNNLKHEPYFDNDLIMNIAEEEDNRNKEVYGLIRKSLSYMTGMYRSVLVMFYYEERKIKDIALKLEVSEAMVKYYLMTGRNKMKEVYKKMENISERSFNPQSLSIRMWGIDFNNINIWSLMARILPQQIAIECYNQPKSIQDIAQSLNVASCFIEEEVAILVDAGLMHETTKKYYQTNFVILEEERTKKIDQLFQKNYQNYLQKVNEAFQALLPQLKKSQIFKHHVSDDRYYAIFIHLVAKFDYREHVISNSEYPIILTNGVRAFIYAYLNKDTGIMSSARSTYGQTPTYPSGASSTKMKDIISWAIDLGAESNHQQKLAREEVVETIYDVYNGIIDENKKELYAQLIIDNYLVKQDGRLYSNIPLINEKTINLLEEVNANLINNLVEITKINEEITAIIKPIMPNNLKQYTKGFAKCIFDTESRNVFYNVVLNNNPYLKYDDLKNQPYFCHFKVIKK